MAKTRERVSDVKPYVERAIKDEEFRDNLKKRVRRGPRRLRRADGTAWRQRQGGPSRFGQRPARQFALGDRRPPQRSRPDPEGAEPQGPQPAAGDGIAIGIFLFNPMTGGDARRWLKESVFGEEDEFGYQGNSGS